MSYGCLVTRDTVAARPGFLLYSLEKNCETLQSHKTAHSSIIILLTQFSVKKAARHFNFLRKRCDDGSAPTRVVIAGEGSARTFRRLLI